jgi:hypothetical protein
VGVGKGRGRKRKGGMIKRGCNGRKERGQRWTQG